MEKIIACTSKSNGTDASPSSSILIVNIVLLACNVVTLEDTKRMNRDAAKILEEVGELDALCMAELDKPKENWS